MRFAIRWAALILISGLAMWGATLLVPSAHGQEHCISPQDIRDHAGKAVLADFDAGDTLKLLIAIADEVPAGFQAEEIIALPAAGETVTLAFFHQGCSVYLARIAGADFVRLAAFVKGEPA